MAQKKILIVDDDPEMRLALDIRLRANNYDVCAAVDGVSAISEARRQMPDLILLDLGLPAADGLVVIDRLQAIDKLSRIPIIVVSGRNRTANEQLALRSGARIFLQKPVRNADLVSAIEKILNTEAESAPVVYDISGSARPTSL